MKLIKKTDRAFAPYDDKRLVGWEITNIKRANNQLHIAFNQDVAIHERKPWQTTAFTYGASFTAGTGVLTLLLNGVGAHSVLTCLIVAALITFVVVAVVGVGTKVSRLLDGETSKPVIRNIEDRFVLEDAGYTADEMEMLVTLLRAYRKGQARIDTSNIEPLLRHRKRIRDVDRLVPEDRDRLLEENQRALLALAKDHNFELETEEAVKDARVEAKLELKELSRPFTEALDEFEEMQKEIARQEERLYSSNLAQELRDEAPYSGYYDGYSV